jgi:hypothetical protein
LNPIIYAQLLTLVPPWHRVSQLKFLEKIFNRVGISRPEISEATSDVTDARWNCMKQCLSVDPFARPSALIAMDFLKSELETVTDDVSS